MSGTDHARAMKQILLVCALVAAISAGSRLPAQTTRARTPPLVIPSLVGRDLFAFYCASCHGRDGRGHGPVETALKSPPPDLTTLARRNNGTYPRERVAIFVANGDPAAPAHGTAEMPVWGPVFRGLDTSEQLAKIRLANVTDYLGSIQER